MGEALVEAIIGPGVVESTQGGRQLDATVVDADRLGVLVDGVRVRGPVADPVGAADRLQQGLRPGGEPLHVHERSPELGGATLRSNRRTDGRYYELRVDGHGAELQRRRVDASGQRSTEPFALTREQLSEAVDQLGGALDPPSGARA